MSHAIAFTAGVLQATGYGIYFWKCVSKDNDPNPVTWLMFSYGTAILGLLEWSRGASLSLLILPAVCATMSLGVMAYCFRQGKMRWPKKRIEWIAFLSDVMMTVAYVATFWLSKQHFISSTERGYCNLVFLICTNLSTVANFLPLYQSVWEKPESEVPSPWLVWSGAYATLGLATILEDGIHKPELLIYPLSCGLLHAFVAILARRHPGSSAILSPIKN